METDILPHKGGRKQGENLGNKGATLQVRKWGDLVSTPTHLRRPDG